MKKRLLLAIGAALAIAPTMTAQRVTDALGRGLVAMKTDAGVFCSWRINADEWDMGTEYNVYRGSTRLNRTPLKVSNFTDPSGTTDATYTIRPVINGIEAAACAPAKVREKNYTIIKPKHAHLPNCSDCRRSLRDSQAPILIFC